MSSKRNDLLNRLNGKVGPLPFFADLSYYYFSRKCLGKLPRQFEGINGEIAFYKQHDAGMYILESFPFPFHIHFTNNVKYEEKRDREGMFAVYQTEIGTLTSYQRFLEFSFAYTEHFIKCVEDLFIMAHIFESMRYSPNYAQVTEADEKVGDAGFLLAAAPICVAPVQKLLSRWAGVEKTVELFCDYPDEFTECVTRMENAQNDVISILAKCPLEIIAFPENLSSEVSGHFFTQHNMPYYKRVNEYLHSYGKRTAIHIDGTLKPCLSKLHNAGFDIAEAITPDPVGDLKPEDLRACAGPEIILWGGLPGSLFTSQFSEKEFCDYVVRMINLNDPKFILGVGDQVPPDTVEGRIRLVSQIIKRNR